MFNIWMRNTMFEVAVATTSNSLSASIRSFFSYLLKPRGSPCNFLVLAGGVCTRITISPQRPVTEEPWMERTCTRSDIFRLVRYRYLAFLTQAGPDLSVTKSNNIDERCPVWCLLYMNGLEVFNPRYEGHDSTHITCSNQVRITLQL